MLQLAPDYLQINEFGDSYFEDVEDAAVTWFPDPPQAWATIAACGNFPCTGPKNTLFSFYGSTFSGIRPDGISGSFSIIPNVTGYSEHLDGCEPREAWNAYVCDNIKLGILLFESQDADKMDRSVQPVYIQREDDADVRTKLNSFMDHGCDGSYPSQKRLSRFPGLIQGKEGDVYDLVYTGTPPKKQKFTFHCMSRSASVTIRIAYPSAESRAVLKDGEIVPYNDWDTDIQNYGPVRGFFCGENRYIGV